MTLAAGTRLGPYEIAAPIGAGGMGQVYRATDTRLGRAVAVKVLAPELSENPDFRQRFEREAKAISQLSHPNICALFDVGSAEGAEYLVMELLEGRMLDDRLEKGPLPLDQVLRHGMEIAAALDRAHRQGIVHRDLKPGNVMLTRSGVKLLDFGLAKLIAPIPDSPVSGLSALPTEAARSRPLTEQGTILGTFQYMAPEQVEGKDADARTDIFALGTVLYEMSTGRKAFTGQTRASLIAAILERDPGPITAAVPTSPPSLDRLVQGCLAKDPDDRWQSAHDVMAQLRWIAEGGSQAGVPAAVSARRRVREKGAWIAAGIAAIAAIVFGAAWLRRPSAPAMIVRSTILPPANSRFAFSGDNAGPLTISPDGRKLAFVAVGNDRPLLYVRPLDADDPLALPGTEDATFPFWSPDGRSLGFFAGGKLKRVDLSAPGSATTIADAPNARGGTWGPDGTILFAPDTRSAIFRVSSSGGTPSPVTKVDPSRHSTHRWPVFLPDGRHFLFFAGDHNDTRSEKAGVRFASLEGPGDRPVVQTLANAVFAGRDLLFLRGNTLLAQNFDPGTGKLAGEPRQVAQGVHFDLATWHAAFTASRTDVLAYQPGGGLGSSARLLEYDRAGKVIGTIGERANYFGPIRLSPDGRRLAVAIGDPGDVYLIDLATGLPTRLTFTPASTQVGGWSPDGSRVVYSSLRQKDGRYGIFSKAASGAEAERALLLAPGAGHIVEGWGRDGRFISYQENVPNEHRWLWLLPLSAGAKPAPALTEHDGDETSSAISPDARWIAYDSFVSGAPSIVVSPLPGPGGKWQVTPAGYSPRWRGDGRELFFLSPDQTLMAAQVDGTGAEFRVGAVTPLFHTHAFSNPGYSFEATPDGQRFIVNSVDSEDAPAITLVLNWGEALGK